MNSLRCHYYLDNKITLAKAIAIVCVVIGHSGCPELMRNLIYLFHMPFFFFIAGYCFKEKYLSDLKTFIVHRIKGLYFPFLKWNIIFIFLHNVFFDLNIYNAEYGSGNGLIRYANHEYPHLISAALRFNASEQLLGVYWFLKSLFLGYVVFYFTLKIGRNTLLGSGVLLIICLVIDCFSIDIPYLGFRTFFPSFFIMTGYIYRKQIETGFTMKYRKYTLIFGTVVLVIASFFIHTEMLQTHGLMIAVYAVLAFVGCIMLLIISDMVVEKKVREKGIVDYIGKHTLSIMTFHFLSFKVVTLAFIIYNQLPIGMLSTFPVVSRLSPNDMWIIYSCFGIACPLIMYRFYEKIKIKVIEYTQK